MKTKDLEKQKVVCYGEVLWDIFPTKTKPGGAPMNVAYHLQKFGVESHMISRVGNDEAGKKLLNLLNDWNIPTTNCQIDEAHETGKVEAIAGANEEMTYVIHESAAWDYIATEPAYDELVADADVFVFGSLVNRNETSRDTLYRLLEKASYKVFDINLRAPFYSVETIEYLLEKCNLLKLNKAELELIITWFWDQTGTEEESVRFIQKEFKIDEVIVTKGSEGATYYTLSESYSYPAFKVTVKDTVGSGDSFLAAFLAKKVQNETPEMGMIYATALGAFVASHEGACPSYNMAQLMDFQLQRQSIL